MTKHQRHFTFSFKPMEWTEALHFAALNNRLIEDKSTFEFTGLNAWQARHQWQLEMPLGIFANDFREGLITLEQDLFERDRLFHLIRPKGFRPTDIIERDGVVYYRKPVLEQVRHYIEHPAMVNAVLAFWNAAEKNRRLIKPAPPRPPRLETWERKQRDGDAWRGPPWTADEDSVLQKWFGRRTVGPRAGHHTYLSKDEWDIVLDALGRRRSVASVRQRLVVLNNRLRQEFVDRKFISGGFIGRTHHEAWLSRVLGERPRPLHVRPSRQRA